MALNPDEESPAQDGSSQSSPTTAELPQPAASAIPAWMIPATDVTGDRARIEPAPAATNGTDPAPLPVRPAGSLVAQQAAVEVAPTPPDAPAPVSDPNPLDVTPVVAVPAVEPLPAVDATVQPAPTPAPRRPWLPGSAPAAPAVAPTAPQPVITSTPIAAVTPAPVAAPTAAPAANAPAGALMLLPGEEVLQQLGALYLTNRRAILYAPTILRAAFLHDIDAVGTLTERSGGWMFLIGLLLLGGGTAAVYSGITQPSVIWSLGELFQFSPLLVGLPLVALGIFTLVSYFFWIKRSLFLSVGGRPLIVVSLTGWNPKKLEPVDQFVNTFSAAKDRDRQRS